jgi:hypothetical protein
VSNYIAQARTNYFTVKDIEALKTALRSYGIEPHPWSAAQTGAEFILDTEKEGSVALFSYGNWPSLEEDPVADRLGVDADQEVPQDHIDLADLVAAHMTEGQIAIFMDVGFEKMRYLGATAVAVNTAGDRRVVDLQDIYGLAQELTDPGTVVTKVQS